MKLHRLFSLLFLMAVTCGLNAFENKDAKDTRETMKPGKDYTEIAAAALKLKLPKDAVRAPMPPPDSRVRNRSGERVDVFSPKELWMHEQSVSYFKGPGFQINVFRMTLPYPSELMRKKEDNNVTRAVFDNWKNTNKFTPESIIDSDQWMKNITGCDLEAVPVKLELLSSAPFLAVKYKLEGENSRNKILYVIQEKNGGNKTFLFVSMENQVDYSDAWKIMDQMISQSTLFTPGSVREEDAKILKTSASKSQRSKEYTANAEAIIDSIKGLKKWYSMEGDGFLILSNSSTRKNTEIIMNEMDMAIKSYQTLFPMFVPQNTPMVIRVVDTMSEMKEHCEWDRTPGAFWNNEKKEVVICPENWKDFSKRPDGMIRALHGSTMQQYVFATMNKSYSSPWFHNGMVTVFHQIEVKNKGKYELSFDRDKEKEIQQRGLDGINASFAKHVDDILKITYMDINNARKGTRFNDTFWAFFYFLVKGAPVVKGQEAYADIPTKFCESFVKNKYNVKKATQEAFAGVDMNKLDKDLRDFWNNKNLISKSRTYNPKPIIVNIPEEQ